jgi:hypothetical protein
MSLSIKKLYSKQNLDKFRKVLDQYFTDILEKQLVKKKERTFYQNKIDKIENNMLTIMSNNKNIKNYIEKLPKPLKTIAYEILQKYSLRLQKPTLRVNPYTTKNTKTVRTFRQFPNISSNVVKSILRPNKSMSRQKSQENNGNGSNRQTGLKSQDKNGNGSNSQTIKGSIHMRRKVTNLPTNSNMNRIFSTKK